MVPKKRASSAEVVVVDETYAVLDTAPPPLVKKGGGKAAGATDTYAGYTLTEDTRKLLRMTEKDWFQPALQKEGVNHFFKIKKQTAGTFIITESGKAHVVRAPLRPILPCRRVRESHRPTAQPPNRPTAQPPARTHTQSQRGVLRGVRR